MDGLMLTGWALFYLASFFLAWQCGAKRTERLTFIRIAELKSRLANAMDHASKLRGESDALRSRLVAAEAAGARAVRKLSEAAAIRAQSERTPFILDGTPIERGFADTMRLSHV